MKRHRATPAYIWDGPDPRKAPLDWDELGNITSWQESTSWPVQCDGDKWAWTWDERQGFIKLWAQTLPPETIEYVMGQDYTPPKGYEPTVKDGVTYHYAPAGIEKKRQDNLWRFALAPLMELPDEFVTLFQHVDEIARMDAWLEGKPDNFGALPYINFFPLSDDVIQKHKSNRARLNECLGELLFDVIRERRGDELSLIAEAVKAAKDVPLTKMEMGNLPIRFAGNDLRGVVWRCYNILDIYLRNPPLCGPCHIPSLPVKRSLKAYVLQEWEAMAGKAVTVETEFSRILKELGLSGLPDASSAPGSPL